MPTYFVHVKEQYFKDNLSRVKCISQLEIYIKKYEGKISFVSEFVPLMFIEIQESKGLTKSNLEQELKETLPFIKSIEESHVLRIVKRE